MIKMGHTAKRMLQSVSLLLFVGVYCGEWCEANYKTGVLRKYCNVGGCCFPADQRSYNEDTDFCCVPLLTVILISVFVGIPAVILVLVCCVCCIKYLKNKNKTRSLQPNQDTNRTATHHAEPKPRRQVHMIGPPPYQGTQSGNDVNIPGTPDYHLRARALSPPPPYSARSAEEVISDTPTHSETRQMASRSQERTVTRVGSRQQNSQTSVRAIAQVMTDYNHANQVAYTPNDLSNRSTGLGSRTARSDSRTDTDSDTSTNGRSSNIGDHLEFI